MQALIEGGNRVMTANMVKQVAHQCAIDPDYTPHLITSLIQDNWLTPLKKGLYKLSQATGISPIHEFEIAMQLVKPAMISYYSAFYHHGLTDQVPKRVYISENPCIVRKGGICMIEAFTFIVQILHQSLQELANLIEQS